MSQNTTIIYCDCAYYENIAKEVKSAVAGALGRSGLDFEAVADLCGLAAKKDSRLRDWAAAESVKIIACYPRAVKWLFHTAGADLDPQRTEIFNMRTMSAEEIISSVVPAQSKIEIGGDIEPGGKGDWVPWFPVIDYERCKSCRQCMNFCLFGVFAVDDAGRVEVANPAGCKTNCPACARVCPQTAIIFPKYESSPINGDEVTEETLVTETAKVDIKQLLSGDIRKAIRSRSGKARFAPSEKANGQGPGSETESFISEIQKKLSIPNDVLTSLSAKDLAQIRQQSDKQDKDNRPKGK